MDSIFVDTSALGRRYISEVGSGWGLNWILPQYGNVIILAEITQIELFAALSRLRKQGILSPNSITTLQANFLLHLRNEYLMIRLNSPVIALARDLADKHSLRALDAIQLASAIEARNQLKQPITFMSGDSNLLLAAVNEGFGVDNPYRHP